MEGILISNRRNPYYLAQLFTQGLVHAQRGNFQEAIKSWEEYATYLPRQYSVWSNLATIYIQTQNFSRAEECCRKALRIQPRNGNEWDKLGSILSANTVLGNKGTSSVNDSVIKESIKCFKKSLKFDKKNDQALFKIGTAYVTLKNFEKAEEFVNKYLKKHPNDAKVKELLRIIKLQAVKESNACEKCGTPLKEGASFCGECGTPIRSSEGVQSINITKLAEIQREKVAEYPGFPDGKQIQTEEVKKLVEKGIEFTRQREFNQAISTLKQAISLEPDVPFLYENLGTIYVMMNDFETAKQFFIKATEINPHQIKAWEVLEGIYQMTGETAKQEWVFNKLKSYGSVYANYLVDMGFRIANAPKVPDRQKQNQMAAQMWRRALLIDPNNQQAQFHLNSLTMFDNISAELDKWKGNYDKAVEYYRKLLEQNPNDRMLFALLRAAEMRQLGLDFL